MIQSPLRRYDTQDNDIQHNDTQHNDIKHTDTQHNNKQKNDTQNNGRDKRFITSFNIKMTRTDRFTHWISIA